MHFHIKTLSSSFLLIFCFFSLNSYQIFIIPKCEVFFIVLFFFSIMFWARDSAGGEWVEWIADAEIVYATNDNINNGMIGPAEESEQVVTPSLLLGRIYQITDFSRLFLTANFSKGFHHNFDDLDFTDIGITTTLRHKLGIGLFKPWVGTSVTYTDINSKSRIREGHRYAIGLSVGKRIHERIDIHAAYAYDNRNSIDSEPAIPPLPGNVYDLKGHKVSAGANIVALENALVSFNYSYRDGDTASSCKAEFIPFPIVQAITVDDGFPKGEFCAYRMESTKSFYAANLSYSFLNGHASANLGYEHIVGKAKDFEYRSNIIIFGINYSY